MACLAHVHGMRETKCRIRGKRIGEVRCISGYCDVIFVVAVLSASTVEFVDN